MEARIVIEFSEIDRNKLNPEFAARLNQLAPHQKVRVVVLLQSSRAENPDGKRQSHLERQATIQSLRESATQSLANINEIIQHFEGKLLMDYPNAWSTISIEITAAGIDALVKSDAVKAVIEDRSIYPIQIGEELDIADACVPGV
jgi:hypothetical protein